MYPLISVLILVLDIAAIADILQCEGPPATKLLWILLVLLLPLVGMILYFWWGRKKLTT